MAKEPGELKWIEDLLPEGYYHRKSMFGGFSYYIGEKMILLTFESDDQRWNGAMFPVDKEFQEEALGQFPFLIPHSILPKWLFLSVNTENFDELVSDVLRVVLRPNSNWGTIPKAKKKATEKAVSEKKSSRSKKDTVDLKIDTRRPRMFSDEPMDAYLEKARKISDLKNLGIESEKQFAKAGITSAQQFIKMGWKKAIEKLLTVNDKHLHSLWAYALIGALKNQEFTRISDEDKAEAQAFVKGIRQARKLAEKAKKKTVPKRPKKSNKKVLKKTAKKSSKKTLKKKTKKK